MIGRRTARILTSLCVAALVGVLGVGGALVSTTVDATAAHAVAPFRVADRITDQVGALGGRTAEVRSHLDRLSADTRFDLWVVFVDTFDGANPQTWADDTATVSQLGVDDILLAVATGDRAYAFSLDTAASVTDAQIAHVRADLVEPLLSSSDWAGAAIAAADGFRAAALGTAADTGSGTGSGAGSTTSTASSGSGSLLVVLVLVLVVLVGGVALVIRSANRRAATSRPGTGGTPGDALAALPTAELSTRASAALVAIDDAIKASEQELGFAQAQFGLEATAAFSAALVDAKRAVAEVFTLRQQLDDTVPETEPQAREMMTQIIRTCDEVGAALDAHADQFGKLRDLQARAPELLDDAETRSAEVVARVPAARTTLAGLATRYPPEALASVSANPDQVERLAAGITETVASGRASLTAEDRGAAVAAARAAQAALAQAVGLLDAVDQAGTQLASAGQSLDAGIASLSSDLADAARLAPTDAALGTPVADARRAVDAAQQARSGGDPLAALRDLTQAEAALDAALAPYRERAEQADRARARLTDLLGRVTAQISALAAYIESRRGAVGPEARTRLSEAARHAQQAQSVATSDAVTALTEATQADQLVQAAQQLAQRDVAAFEEQQRRSSGPGGTPGGTAGLILGGILIDQLLRGGGRGGGFGGGFGGGGFGGGFGGGGRGGRGGGGGFGGGGGRGGRGGGGRF